MAQQLLDSSSTTATHSNLRGALNVNVDHSGEDVVEWKEKVRAEQIDSESFWNSSIVKNIGKSLIRPAVDKFTDQVMYFIIRQNKAPYQPSIIKLGRKAAVEFAIWGKMMLGQLETFEDKGILPKIGYNINLLSLKKTDANFWHADMTYNYEDNTTGKFRARLYKSENVDCYAFYINNQRELEEYPNWCGPTMFMARSDFRNLLKAIEEYEGKFAE
jgi:hypothetical protein